MSISKEKTKLEDKESKTKDLVCQRCGRHRRDCASGCRNTIVIPYGSQSNKTIVAGEAESLRMLIKV